MEEFIQGVQKNGQLYLPLGEISVALDFPITVNADEISADGWFINEKNHISLNKNSVSLKGEKSEFPPGSMIVKDQDIYIESTLLQTWFPMNFSLSRENMTLDISTRESLPHMEALMRKKLQAKLASQKKSPEDIEYKNIYSPYSVVQWPSVDLTLSTAYQSEGRALQTDFSTVAAGEFGYLTTRLYAVGNYEQKYTARNSDSDLITGISGADNLANDNSSKKVLSDIRLSMGRTDYERKLLGPIRASSYLFGDINAISLSQVTSSGQGRGLTLTNRALNRPDNFDITSFIGDTRPGWDVELYRNDALIAFQTE